MLLLQILSFGTFPSLGYARVEVRVFHERTFGIRKDLLPRTTLSVLSPFRSLKESRS